ncbi:MAG TPA: hypothetical protein VFJ05_07000 [Nitrososphaeraceae archaeon]|nr:hypothetical protein [Nitrososphaeraceae archaeon]
MTKKIDFEKEFKEIVEYNKKVVTKDYKLNFSEYRKQSYEVTAKYFKDVVSEFTEEEKRNAMVLIQGIYDRVEPRDGAGYIELAAGILHHDIHDLKDDEYEKGISEITPKVDRMLYVAQHIILQFYFEHKIDDFRIFPVARWVDDYVNNNDGTTTKLEEPEEIIFNGYKDKYLFEEFFRLGLIGKIEEKK